MAQQYICQTKINKHIQQRYLHMSVECVLAAEHKILLLIEIC